LTFDLLASKGDRFMAFPLEPLLLIFVKMGSFVC